MEYAYLFLLPQGSCVQAALQPAVEYTIHLLSVVQPDHELKCKVNAKRPMATCAVGALHLFHLAI